MIFIENKKHSARNKPERKGKIPPKILAVVHQSGCTGCSACIAGCPVDSIEIIKGPLGTEMNQVVEIDLARCIGCQNCSKDCPWETITMYKTEDVAEAWARETLMSELYLNIDQKEE